MTCTTWRNVAPTIAPWLCALALAGCGAEPGSGLDVGGDVRAAMPIPDSTRVAPDQDALDHLVGAMRAQKALAGATWRARVYVRGSVGRKPKDAPWAAGADWEGRTVWEVAYAKPDVHRFQAVESTLPGQVGLRVLLERGGALVRQPGFMGLIARKRDLQDPLLLDFRGHALAHLTPMATLARLAGSATARIVGESRLDGALIDLVEVPRTPDFDPEVAKEVLGIERASHALRLHAMYDVDGRKVYEQQLLGLRGASAGPVGKLAI